MPLFGKSHKSPPDIIVKNLRDALLLIERNDKKTDKAVEEVNRYLQAVKSIIYGGEHNEPHTEQVGNLYADLSPLFVWGCSIGSGDIQRKCPSVAHKEPGKTWIWI